MNTPNWRCAIADDRHILHKSGGGSRAELEVAGVVGRAQIARMAVEKKAW